jgi:hypothetical protein
MDQELEGVAQLEVCGARNGLPRGIAHTTPNQPLLSWCGINEVDNSASAVVPSMVDHEVETSRSRKEMPSCPELRALEGCGLECENDVPDLDYSPWGAAFLSRLMFALQ